MCRCESVCSHQRSVALSVFLRLHNHNSNHNVLTPLPLKRAYAYSCSQVASYGKPANAQSISGKKRTAGPGMHLWATQVPRKLTGDVALHQHFIRSIRKTQRIRVAQDPSTAVYFSNDDHSTMSVDSSTFSDGGLARRVLVPEKSTAHTYKSDYTESWAHMTVFACWIRSFMLDADGNPVPTNSHVATIVRPKFQVVPLPHHVITARRAQVSSPTQLANDRYQVATRIFPEETSTPLRAALSLLSLPARISLRQTRDYIRLYRVRSGNLAEQIDALRSGDQRLHLEYWSDVITQLHEFVQARILETSSALSAAHALVPTPLNPPLNLIIAQRLRCSTHATFWPQQLALCYQPYRMETKLKATAPVTASATPTAFPSRLMNWTTLSLATCSVA